MFNAIMTNYFEMTSEGGDKLLCKKNIKCKRIHGLINQLPFDGSFHMWASICDEYITIFFNNFNGTCT